GDVRNAFQLWRGGQPRPVGGLLARHVPAAGEDDPRGFEWHHLRRQSDRLRQALTGHGGEGRAVAFAPGGQTLASAGRGGLRRRWGAAGGRLRAELAGHQGPVHALAFAPDGKTLYSAGQDGQVRLWDLPEGKGHALLATLRGPVRGLAFSPDGKTLAAADGAEAVWLWG